VRSASSSRPAHARSRGPCPVHDPQDLQLSEGELFHQHSKAFTRLVIEFERGPEQQMSRPVFGTYRIEQLRKVPGASRIEPRGPGPIDVEGVDEMCRIRQQTVL
jgi:hypothetical protein